MDQALNSQKTPHTSPLRASYGMSFVSILMKNDRVIKGFYCTCMADYWCGPMQKKIKSLMMIKYIAIEFVQARQIGLKVKTILGT